MRRSAVLISVTAITVSGLLAVAASASDRAGSTADRAAATTTGRRPQVSTVEPTVSLTAPTTSLFTLDPALQSVPARVYVPNGKSNTVSVIDPATRRVVGTFKTGKEPQHVVPSYDLRTLWVLDNAGNDVIPVDPMTSAPAPPIPVQDPYNLYFTPDGTEAIVVAEAEKRLDLRDPHSMALRRSIPVPACDGVNHIDYPGDYTYLVATCEFSRQLAKIDFRTGAILGMLDLPPDLDGTAAMPQDVRVGPDGTTFYVADMTRGGIYVVDGADLRITNFVPTGIGAHGITPSRDGTELYVANRGSRAMSGARHGAGSVSVVDLHSQAVVDTWPVPDGGSPDMGNLSTDGAQLWLSGRFDHEVYVFDLVARHFDGRIRVGSAPHGLTYWPQPGRFSLGHTGNMR